jgi:YbbR domain-containing protein
MPFQDIQDDAIASLPRPPSTLERWVRKIFVEDWNVKLLAAAITVALWLAVTGQNTPITQRVSGVQLNFTKDENVEISNDVPTTLEVVLSGSQARLDEIAPRGLIATVDLRNQKTGERVVRLSQDNVQMIVPAGVTIRSFRPATIAVKLEPLVEMQLPVDVKLEGNVAEGYEIAAVTTTPEKIRLRGPADHVKTLQKATTETVSLEGRRESFTISNVAISVADPKIEVIDAAVNVHVEVVERKRIDVHLRLGNDPSAFVALILLSSLFR